MCNKPVGIHPSDRLVAMCHWMGSHFLDRIHWSYYSRNGVANFQDFGENNFLVSKVLKLGRFAVKKLLPSY